MHWKSISIIHKEIIFRFSSIFFLNVKTVKEMSAIVVSKEPHSLFESNDLLYRSYFNIATHQHTTILRLSGPLECLTPPDPVQIYSHFITYKLQLTIK